MSKKSIHMIIRIAPETKKQLWKEAKKEERTLSNYVLRLVEKGREAIRKTA